MSRALLCLSRSGSCFAAALGERARAEGWVFELLDLDAPLRGEPVTVSPGAVTWQGRSLLEASAIVVETPVVCWPQPELPAEPERPIEELRAAAAREREARSLLVSALAASSEAVPVLNPLSAMHLVASPLAALDRLSAESLPVHPWRLEPLRAEDADAALDVVGRNRWHEPCPPAAGEPAMVLEPVTGPVLRVLVIGQRAAAAVSHPDAASWRRGDAGRSPERERPETSSAERLAEKAAWSLALPLVEITCTATSSPAVLAVDSAPDLSHWEQLVPSRPSEALVHHLREVMVEDPLVRF